MGMSYVETRALAPASRVMPKYRPHHRLKLDNKLRPNAVDNSLLKPGNRWHEL